MNAMILKASMMAALVVAIAAFILCVVVAVSPFLGFADIFARATFLLFVGMFPLFFGAARVLGRRTKGQRFKDWAPILFRGLPKWFTTAYRFYFLVIWVGGVAAFIQVFRGQPSWIGLLFVLVPSVFYLTCVGAYWSVVREMADGEQGLPADAEDGEAKG